MKFSEEQFTSWAKGPGKTEQEKCDNAETAIRKALDSHEKLSALDITVLPQGSYRNKTNVKQDSDVDICVRLNSTFFPDYPKGKQKGDFGNVDGSITFADYKSLVQEALENYFGKSSVTRGNKAFDIHANTYRVDADVVAALEHRRYSGRYNDDGTHHYSSGIGFDTDKGERITNWPVQHYENGLEKHEATSRRFRKVIRTLKHIRNLMQEDKIPEASGIASCLIEHLVWNTPNANFGSDSISNDLRNVLIYTFDKTKKIDDCKEWGEMSELLYLFRSGKPWTLEQANNFIMAVWNYVGFK